jgi:hypothetical protein
MAHFMQNYFSNPPAKEFPDDSSTYILNPPFDHDLLHSL